MALSDNPKAAKRRLFVLFGLLLYVFSAAMLAVFSVKLPLRDVLKMAMVAFGLCTLLSLCWGYVFSRKNILLPLVALLVIILASTTATYLLWPATKTTFTYGVRQVFDSVTWVAIFAWAYYIGANSVNVIEKTTHVSWAIIVFFVLFLGILRENTEQAFIMRSTAYYGLFLLPFIFRVKNRTVKWGMVALAFLMVLLSRKRGGFVAFVVAVAVYYIVDFRQTPNGNVKKLRMIVGALVAMLVGYFVLQYYAQTYNLGILDRLLAIQTDEGSGRIEIWQQTIDLIKNSSPVSFIFGHGFNRVIYDLPLKVSAHNDLLEVLYDYGIVGTALYVAVIGKVFAGYKTVKQRKPHVAAPYAASLALFLCLSAVSHLVIYPTYFLLLCAYWGVVLGELDQNVRLRRKE